MMILNIFNMRPEGPGGRQIMGSCMADIARIIEKAAPLDLAESWDNTGMLLGDEYSTVRRVLVCLDVTQAVVHEAVDSEADMIISHHPLIFQPLKNILSSSETGSILMQLIAHRIRLYAAHTNLDLAPGGLNDELLRRLGLSSLNEDALPRIGRFPSPMTLEEFIQHAKNRLELESIRMIPADQSPLVQTVAVASGAYQREYLPLLKEKRPDILVTGDVKYHEALELASVGQWVMDAGHYGTEKHAADLLMQILSREFDMRDPSCRPVLIRSASSKDPFTAVFPFKVD